jgi:hypothetical protein
MTECSRLVEKTAGMLIELLLHEQISGVVS